MADVPDTFDATPAITGAVTGLTACVVKLNVCDCPVMPLLSVDRAMKWYVVDGNNPVTTTLCVEASVGSSGVICVKGVDVPYASCVVASWSVVQETVTPDEVTIESLTLVMAGAGSEGTDSVKFAEVVAVPAALAETTWKL